MNEEAETIHQAGRDFAEQKKYLEAIASYQQAFILRKKLTNQMGSANDTVKSILLESMFKSLQNQGTCYYIDGNYKKALEIQEECILLLKEVAKTIAAPWVTTRLITAYRFRGKTNNVLGKLEKSIQDFQFAHVYCSSNPTKKNQDPCRSLYIDYSELYVGWLEADSIIKYAELAIAINRAGGFLDEESPSPFLNSGIGYSLNKEYDEALINYDSALAIYQAFEQPIFIAKTHHNKALLLLESGKPDEALFSIDLAMKINSQIYLSDSSALMQLAGNLVVKGDIWLKKGKYSKAAQEYDQAIFILDSNASYSKNRLGSDYKFNLLEAKAGKAASLFALRDYQAALNHYDAAIELINHFRQSFTDQYSKTRLTELTKKTFEGAIEVCLVLSKDEEAFAYAEQSKSFVLLESVLQLKAMSRLPDINPKLQQDWNDARTEISRLKKELVEYENSTAQYADLQEKIKVQEDKVSGIEQAFQKIEAYVKLTTTLTPPDVSVIQNTLLEDNQAFVEYFIGEKQSYLFYIPKNGKLKTYRLNINRGTLAQKTDSLLFAIRLPHADTSSIKDKGIISFFEAPDMVDRCDKLYAQYASELYDKLLAVVRPPYVDLPERLIIIPDDVLGYLPFDALLTNKPAVPAANNPVDYASYPFLWKSPCHISYCYSGALLKEMRDNDDREGGNEMLAFAHPQRGFKKQLQDLKKLFEAPWSLFAGNFKVIQTKDQLKESVQNTRYLHFSTHGHVDDRNPNYSYLDMRQDGETSTDENRLYLFEIYNLKAQNTAMVVTSACETGFGRLNRGEGIISLARGFSSAGASSIITTLWSVYQTQSGELFNIFYQNLQDGKTTKDEALSNAKASFVERNKQFAAPYYWASIVPVGEMEPVALPQKSGEKSALLLGGLAIALIIGLFLKKSLQRRRQ
ncbi:MAG: CHAT domain-containing protein [Saprospiraceae bacterium]